MGTFFLRPSSFCVCFVSEADAVSGGDIFAFTELGGIERPCFGGASGVAPTRASFIFDDGVIRP